jgi:uncharacterized protein
MPPFEPPPSEASAPYWEATKDQRLVLPWCTACDRPHWYPRELCPWCLTDTIEWRPASGTGEVYAVSVQHRPGPMRDAADGPYAVALIDLTEGVRVMSNVVGVEPDAVTVGRSVTVQWEPLSDGRHLPLFRPTGD